MKVALVVVVVVVAGKMVEKTEVYMIGGYMFDRGGIVLWRMREVAAL